MEDYVTYAQAKALRELGFDWECNHFYDTSNERPNLRGGYYDFNHDGAYDDTSAPTMSQAAKWLREVKGISVEPVSCGYEDNVSGNIVWCSFICLLKDKLGYNQTATFDTYEQALSAGIDKVLELLK